MKVLKKFFYFSKINNGHTNAQDTQVDYYLDSSIKWPYNGLHTTTILKDNNGLVRTCIQFLKKYINS